MNFESYKQEVQGFVDRGNYHAAINVALSGLNAYRRSCDQAGIDRCLALIREVVETLAEDCGSRKDSAQQ